MSLFRRSARRGAAAAIGLSANEVCLLWRVGHAAPLQWRGAACRPGEASEQIGCWLNADSQLASLLRTMPLSVTASDELVRCWLVHAPPGTASLSELQAYARLRHEELFGSSLETSVLRADWRSGNASVCFALPAAVVDDARTMRVRLRLPVRALVPASIRLFRWWDQPRRGHAEVVICRSDDRTALVWRLNGRRPLAVRSLRLHPAHPEAIIAAELARAGLSTASEVQPITVFDTVATRQLELDREGVSRHAAMTDLPPGLEASAASFAALAGLASPRPTPRFIDALASNDVTFSAWGDGTTPLRRFAYGMGLCASLALASWQGWAWYGAAQERADLERTLTARSATLAQASPKPAAPLSNQQRTALARVVAQLNFDWHGLLDELERLTPPDVAILEIEPRPSASALGLSVEVRDAAALLRYTDALSRSSQLHDVHVLKHETNDRDSAKPLRFTLSAAMRPSP
ncbi:PilN domain-containing protein [Aquabacterium humicola]|uniref:PilN domain-containing protein n=1 Tax=Aquabacterium humicola TaxID=3237377 RepID=UPI002542AD11|nr:PilN domain-containing protein [Rubrivivax pictus]